MYKKPKNKITCKGVDRSVSNTTLTNWDLSKVTKSDLVIELEGS